MGGDTHGGTIFGTKLGKGPAPDVTTVAQQTPPAPVQDASLSHKIAREISPVTPAQAAEVPKVTPKPETPEFPKNKSGETPTPPTRPTAIVTPPTPVKAPDESSTQNFLKSQGIGQKVPGAATGGSFLLPDGGFSMEPINVNRGDNMAAVSNKTGQPLFTARSDEAMSYDPSQRRVDVTPSSKIQGSIGANDGMNMRSEMDALRQELSNIGTGNNKVQQPQQRQVRDIPNDNPLFNTRLTRQGEKPWANPAFERAMNRTRIQETGDPLNGHFSSGNTNG
jgi:hypothetical protein